MKHVLFAILFSLVMPAMVHAELPNHMDGLGLFTFKSSVGPAGDKNAAQAYASNIKEMGFSFVMLKSHDGGSWGTKVNGKWMPAVSKDLIEAFHNENMRVYTYFTARTKSNDSIVKSVELAALTLDMGADGVIIDDLGLATTSPDNWEPLFKAMRKEVDKRKDKILASSTFPHMASVKGRYWRTAFTYSDYFLPQEYWMQFKAGKNKMTPQNALAYGQGQFDSELARMGPEAKCKLVPIGRTYGVNTTAKEINQFLEAAMPYYPGAGLFVIEKEPKVGGWNAIKDTAKKYKPGRSVTRISLIDAFNNPPKNLPGANAPGKLKPGKGHKQKAEPQTTQPTKPSGPMRSIKVRY